MEKQQTNIIVYYCDDEKRVISTDLTFTSSQNIAIDIYNKVKEHSTNPGMADGNRHSITFYDFTVHKCMVLPHMWPLQKYPCLDLSPEEENVVCQCN